MSHIFYDLLMLIDADSQEENDETQPGSEGSGSVPDSQQEWPPETRRAVRERLPRPLPASRIPDVSLSSQALVPIARKSSAHWGGTLTELK